MEQTKIKEGYVKLSSPNGIRDKRNGRVYSEAEVKERDVKFFESVNNINENEQ